jgi:hypothetical protein
MEEVAHGAGGVLFVVGTTGGIESPHVSLTKHRFCTKIPKYQNNPKNKKTKPRPARHVLVF